MMEMFSTMISAIQLIISIIVFFKLHIVYIPMILCDMFAINPALTEKIFYGSLLIWTVTIVKSVINFLKTTLKGE